MPAQWYFPRDGEKVERTQTQEGIQHGKLAPARKDRAKPKRHPIERTKRCEQRLDVSPSFGRTALQSPGDGTEEPSAAPAPRIIRRETVAMSGGHEFERAVGDGEDNR